MGGVAGAQVCFQLLAWVGYVGGWELCHAAVSDIVFFPRRRGIQGVGSFAGLLLLSSFFFLRPLEAEKTGKCGGAVNRKARVARVEVL